MGGMGEAYRRIGASAYRRVGVWAFEKSHQFRRNLPGIIAVERQSDFQSAETPIRFPTPPVFIATL
jgi:hypothetical protein